MKINESNPNLVSIIIPCYNSIKYTKLCVGSVLKYTTSSYELILIDNGSIDGTAEYFRKLKKSIKTGMGRKISRLATIISKKNLGVSGSLNRGIKISKGEYVCYLNNDVIVTIGWLEGLIRCAESDKRIGIVGCSSNSQSKNTGYVSLDWSSKMKEIQRTAILISLSRKGICKREHFIHGLCMFIKREVINNIGLFDERYFPCFGDDLDYSFRAKKAGYRLVSAMDVYIYHFYCRSTKSKIFLERYGKIEDVSIRSKRLFISKWGLAGVRYYRKLS